MHVAGFAGVAPRVGRPMALVHLHQGHRLTGPALKESRCLMFYKQSLYYIPSAMDGDPQSHRKFLSRFRDKKTGWKLIKEGLTSWRKKSVDFATTSAEPDDYRFETYRFLTRVIAMWADVDLRIDSTPIRRLGMAVEWLRVEVKSSPSWRDPGPTAYPATKDGKPVEILVEKNWHPDPALSLNADEWDKSLCDAIICWERIYDASEVLLAPISTHSDGKRPAYARDHLFRQGKVKESMTAAKIRDRWNDMGEYERTTISPLCSREVKLEQVKTSLKTAKTDQQNGK